MSRDDLSSLPDEIYFINNNSIKIKYYNREMRLSTYLNKSAE